MEITKKNVHNLRKQLNDRWSQGGNDFLKTISKYLFQNNLILTAKLPQKQAMRPPFGARTIK